MKSRSLKLYLTDILESISAIKDFTKDMDRATFLKDLKTQDAVLRRFEIIGEAIKSLPISIRDYYPNINWRAIIGVRNIISHEYFDVEMERMWVVIETKLTDLETVIHEISMKVDNTNFYDYSDPINNLS